MQEDMDDLRAIVSCMCRMSRRGCKRGGIFEYGYRIDGVRSSTWNPPDGVRLDGSAPSPAAPRIPLHQDELSCKRTRFFVSAGKGNAARNRHEAFSRIRKDLELTKPISCQTDAIDHVKELRMSLAELQSSKIGYHLRKLGTDLTVAASVQTKANELLDSLLRKP